MRRPTRAREKDRSGGVYGVLGPYRSDGGQDQQQSCRYGGLDGAMWMGVAEAWQATRQTKDRGTPAAATQAVRGYTVPVYLYGAGGHLPQLRVCAAEANASRISVCFVQPFTTSTDESSMSITRSLLAWL